MGNRWIPQEDSPGRWNTEDDEMIPAEHMGIMGK